MKSTLTQLNVVWRYTVAVVSSSLLPTFWSNCLAGWWLGGGGNLGRLLCLLVGVTCLVAGAIFFKLVYHSDVSILRSIDNILISNNLENRHWWLVSFGWCALGLAVLSSTGPAGTVLALMAILSSVIHGTVCRVVSLAPIFLGINRLTIYLLAADSGEMGITGLSVWSGLALGFYVTGVGFLERTNTKRAKANFWPGGFLLAPLLLAFAVNGFSRLSLLLCVVFLIWTLVSLRYGLPGQNRNPTYMASNLTTGIVLVDLLATGGEPIWLLMVFGLLFVMILLNSPRQPLLNRI